MPSFPPLIVICGPTASGKSGLAIALAQRLQAWNPVIFSADSRQIYRDFDIGTAKPTLAEQAGIPHYLIDCCDPTVTFTVADYQETYAQELQSLLETGKPVLPLLVGGTGLYIKAIVRGLRFPRVPPDPDLRSQLQHLGQAHCHQLLNRVDPTAAAKIHSNDAVRTLRALEVFYATGQPLSAQQGEQPPSYPILQIGLDCDTLDDRIAQRTTAMVEAGLVSEVQNLCGKYGADLPLLKTLGYAEFQAYLSGKFSLDAAIAHTTLHTRQFAKRQRTWFRAVPAIAWLTADSPDLLEHVEQKTQKFLCDFA